MVNLFRPKTMRRMAVFMALVAPIVYLFGSLFFALNGAHGQEVFAEPVYVEDWEDVEGFSDDGGTYSFVVTDAVGFGQRLRSIMAGSTVFATFDFDGSTFRRIYVYGSDAAPSYSFYPNIGDNSGSFINICVDGNVRVPLPWRLILDPSTYSVSLRFVDDSFGYLQKIVSVPSSNVPENAGAYSDYIFKNFFAKDNFLVQWGVNAISEEPRGFAPFGAFWRYLDTNVLHLSNDQVGLMAYGYMYYAAHVLLFDIGFMLVTFFLSFIQKAGDNIGGEER